LEKPVIVADAVATKDAVIFDLFFTLVSTDIKVEEFPPTHEVLGVDKAMWRQQTFGTSSARLTGAEMDPYKIVGSMAHAIDPMISSTVIREATDQRIHRFEHILLNVPDTTISTLKTLRRSGHKTALVTNADSIETRAWDKSPLAPLFDVTVMSWEVGFVKPDARIYNHCLDLLGIPAARAVFVGDGGSRELWGAKAVGLSAVFAKGLMPELTEQEIRSREDDADYTIDGLHELSGK
jgi:putative hydrolase of the HAD superfamily